MIRLAVKGIQAVGLGPLSLELAPGECVAISGASGAGKSRLLRALADLDVHQGEVLLDGVSRTLIRPALWRRRVGLLPPDSHWWLTDVGEHFSDAVDPTALAALGLAEALLAQPVARLSSGERQRFALLRLFANRPQVLLLDEPTANLDATNAGRVEALVAEYTGGTGAAVLWVSHDAEQRRRVATRRLHMTDGRFGDEADRSSCTT